MGSIVDYLNLHLSERLRQHRQCTTPTNNTRQESRLRLDSLARAQYRTPTNNKERGIRLRQDFPFEAGCVLHQVQDNGVHRISYFNVNLSLGSFSFYPVSYQVIPHYSISSIVLSACRVSPPFAFLRTHPLPHPISLGCLAWLIVFSSFHLLLSHYSRPSSQ